MFCIFCIFCYSAVIAMNWAWFRINYKDYKLSKNMKTKIQQFVDNGGDIFIAIIWAIVIAAMIIFKFW